MSDTDGEATETQVWLDVAKDCKYMNLENHDRLISEYKEVGNMLGNMIRNPEKFKPRASTLPTAAANRQHD